VKKVDSTHLQIAQREGQEQQLFRLQGNVLREPLSVRIKELESLVLEDGDKAR